MRKTAWFIFCLAIVTMAAASVSITRLPADSAGVRDDAATPGHAALRATIDPETGRREIVAGPSLALDHDTQNALRRDTDGLKILHHPNGARSVNLQGRFQSATVARIGPDGKALICTDEADHAHNALNAPATSAEPPEVK